MRNMAQVLYEQWQMNMRKANMLRPEMDKPWHELDQVYQAVWELTSQSFQAQLYTV